jgi:hypothetical protein
VYNPGDAGIPGDVFSELVEANRCERHGLAVSRRNRTPICSAGSPDLFSDPSLRRGRRTDADELLPSPVPGRVRVRATVLLDELEAAIDDLPEEQRDVRRP